MLETTHSLNTISRSAWPRARRTESHQVYENETHLKNCDNVVNEHNDALKVDDNCIIVWFRFAADTVCVFSDLTGRHNKYNKTVF